MKLPRVPVTDNLVGVDTVVYRDLWKHIGKDLPKTSAAAKLSAFDLLPMLRTALTTLYNHYAGGSGRWERAGIGVPPVFIVEKLEAVFTQESRLVITPADIGPTKEVARTRWRMAACKF